MKIFSFVWNTSVTNTGNLSESISYNVIIVMGTNFTAMSQIPRDINSNKMILLYHK